MASASAPTRSGAGCRGLALCRGGVMVVLGHHGGRVAVLEHPTVGAVYRVQTVLLSGRDPKPKRPAVTIALPPFGVPDMPVLTRTSDVSERGVFHPANPALGLTKDGVFAFRHLRSLDRRFFTTDAVEFLGMLEEEYFMLIVKWWES